MGGYYSTLSGRIEIEPSLSRAEMRATGYDRESALVNDRLIMITTEEAENGTTTIVPVNSGGEKMSTVGVELQELCKHPILEGRKLTGYIVRSGEEQGDVERFDGTGQSERAQLRWPDGSEVEL